MTPTTMLHRAILLTERLVQVAMWINGALLILVAVAIGIDVLTRKFFAVTIGGSDELGGYVLAISSAWAASYTLLKRGHIRMDVVYSHLGGRLQRVLDLFALAALALFMGFVTFYGWKVVDASVHFGSRSNTPLRTPLFIPQGLWFAGLVMFLFTIAVVIVATVAAFAGSRDEAVRRVTGVASADDEVVEEMDAVRHRLESAGPERQG